MGGKTGLINKTHKQLLGCVPKKKKALELERGWGQSPPRRFRCSSNAGFVSDEAKLSLSLFTVAFRILGRPRMQEGPLRIPAGRLAFLLDNEAELSDPGEALRRAAAP